jgi:hypothetical protein
MAFNPDIVRPLKLQWGNCVLHWAAMRGSGTLLTTSLDSGSGLVTAAPGSGVYTVLVPARLGRPRVGWALVTSDTIGNINAMATATTSGKVPEALLLAPELSSGVPTGNWIGTTRLLRHDSFAFGDAQANAIIQFFVLCQEN